MTLPVPKPHPPRWSSHVPVSAVPKGISYVESPFWWSTDTGVDGTGSGASAWEILTPLGGEFVVGDIPALTVRRRGSCLHSLRCVTGAKSPIRIGLDQSSSNSTARVPASEHGASTGQPGHEKLAKKWHNPRSDRMQR